VTFTTSPSANRAPIVSAGADQSIALPAGAALDGTVNDDGQPNPVPTVTWSLVSGPGTVTFGDAHAVDTSAAFSSAGTYVLRLTADDGALTAGDDVTVVVAPRAGSGAVDVRVTAGSDDAEEASSGSVNLTSSDLEMVLDGSVTQTVGMRFAGVGVPAGATITSAYVQFVADESQSEATALTIKAQASDNPPTFTTASRNVSSSLRTAAAVSWSPAPWTAGAVGAAQRTPDLSAVVQEVVRRTGWTSGNALALVVTGTGHRTGVAFNGIAAQAPLLHVEFS
jgi:hypothetical protein